MGSPFPPEIERQTRGAVNRATASPLLAIAERIATIAYQAKEIAVKLNAHADAVHGPVPVEMDDRDEIIDKPAAALDRINEALDGLDRQLGALAMAAGRNTTLA